MNASFTRNALQALAVLAFASLVAGCQESTNIASSGRGVTSCGSLLGAICVSGRFVDETVENLDFECGLSGVGTVRSVTDVDGSFSCPSGSIVTFSLTHPEDAASKIVLGSVKVQKPSKASPGLYFNVLPTMLAGSSGAVTEHRGQQVARLLQTLNTDTVSASLPSHHIKITNEQKRLINAALFPEVSVDVFTRPAAADPANPQENEVDYYFAAYIDLLHSSGLLRPGMPDQMVGVSEASAMQTKGVYSTFAGAYASGPTLILTGTAFDADFGNMVGNGSTDAGKRFLGQFWSLVDRRGRMVGYGIYSYGPPATTTTLGSNPQAMDLEGFETEGTFKRQWPVSGDLAGLAFSLQGDPGKEVELTQGVMFRGAIAGSENLYINLFEESLGETKLGQWRLQDSSSIYLSGAPYSLLHTVSAAPLMDPELWDTTAISFPVPLEVTLYNTDSDLCPETKGCPIARIPLLVLEDGNIVSDISERCGVDLDPETLIYPPQTPFPAQQEYPLGLVTNIQRGGDEADGLRDESGAAITIMTPLVLIPNEPTLVQSIATSPAYERYLPYSQFLSNFGGHSLLRVDGGAGQKYQMYGLCNSNYVAAGLCDVDGRFAPGIAVWMNDLSNARIAYYGATATANPAEADAYGKNNDGLIRSTLRTCP